MKTKLRTQNAGFFTFFPSNDQKEENNHTNSSFARAATRIILMSILIITSVMTSYAVKTTSPIPGTVSLSPTTTTISSSNTPSSLGSNVVFTATIRSSDFFSLTYFDGGTVTFTEGAVVLAADVPLGLTGSFSSITGTATFNTSGLSVGNHFINVLYNGNSNFASSTATIVQAVVDPTTCATFTGNIAYVNASVSGSNNSGNSWANAFLTLEEALDAARNCGVTQIWVAKGTYMPTDYPIGISTSATLTDRNYTFEMVDGVAVYGGFSGDGTETNINQRNWASNQTILQGNNHFYNVVISINDGNTTKLDGFTVTGGNANATTGFTFESNLYYLSPTNGGGLNTYNSSIEVNNCLFYGNNASSSGGAINVYKGSPSFNNLVVKNNTALAGGGLASSAGSTIRNSVFSENTAGSGGGLYLAAIFYRSGEVNTLINVVISKNQSPSNGGGGIANNSSIVNYVNCTFYGNHTTGTGGAMYNVNYCIQTDLNSIYYGNSADGGFNDIRNYTPGGDLYTPTTVLFGNPLFVNETDPDGPDNIWMTNDDGLGLQSTSPSINAGTLAGSPATDIRGVSRTGNPDQGAYEFGNVSSPTSTVITSNHNPSCSGTSVTFTATVTSGGNPVTVGSVTFSEGITTLVSNVSVNASGQAAFNTSLLSAGNHIIKAVYSGNASFLGSDNSTSQTVNPIPDAVATPSSQTICSGSPISTVAVSGSVSGAVYNWNRDNTGSVTGIADSDAGDISGSLTNTTSAPITVTFTVTPSANGCTGLSTTATVLVNPVPDAVASPSSQTICSGSSITTIAVSGSVSGAAYNWTRDNTVSVTGIAAVGEGNISGTLVNTTNAPLTVTFTITPSANNCEGAAVTATVLVNPLTNISGNPASQTIFASTNTSFSVVATGMAPVTYRWQVSTNGGATYSNLSDGGVYSGTTSTTLSLTSVPITMNGYRYQCVVTGGCTQVTSTSALLTVKKRPTLLTYGGDLTKQYTDIVNLSATLTDSISGLGLGGKTITFTLGSGSVSGTTNSSGIATAILQLTQAPGNLYTVGSYFAGDVNYATSSDSDPFTITQENACASYTGPIFVNTSTATALTTSIVLSAVVSQEADGSLLNFTPGSNFSFAFAVTSDANGSVSLVGSPVYNASTSTVTQTASVSITNGQISTILDVKWTIGRYFTNIDCSEQESVVTVAVPGNDYSAGGGYLVLGANSGGIKKGLAGTKNNFGYNIRWAKGFTKLTGNFNTIWRQAGLSFQARSNSASALIVSQIPNTSPVKYKAQITYTNVNMKQIDCVTNCWSDGNGTVILTVYDWGEPGANGSQTVKDQIGVAVRNKSGVLVYSTNTYTVSNPDPTAVLNLDGGNIQVKTSMAVKIEDVTDSGPLSLEKAPANLSFKVYPNPTKGEFTVSLQLPESIDAKAQIQLVNMMGKTVHTEDAEMGNGILQKTITTPSSFANGLYMVRILLNDKLYRTQLIFAR